MADTYSGIHDLTEITTLANDDEFEVAQKNGAVFNGKRVKVANMRLLPATTSSDEGKFLVVNSSGVPEFVTISAWAGGNY